MLKLLPVALLVFCSTGCETFYPPVNYVSAKNRIQSDGFGVMQSTSNRRFVYIVPQKGADGSQHSFVFAEPPPDTALQETLKLAAKIPTTAGTAEGNLDYASQVVDLTKRTQTVVLLRDSLFRLIEARANNVINDAQYVELYKYVFAGVRDLSGGKPEEAEAKRAAAQSVENISDAIAGSTKGTPGSASRPALDPALIESLQNAVKTLDKMNAPAPQQ